MHTLAEFETLVLNCIEAAEAKYGKMGPIRIRFDLKGKSAGMAGAEGINRITREVKGLYLRFNVEAIRKNWDEMVNQTIPHEVAHIVAYSFPVLGAKNHNWKWAQIDRSLGGTGERCHNMELTPGRKTTRFIYKDSLGREMSVGPKHHAALQRGKYGYLRNRKTGATITRSDFLRQAA